MKKIILLLFALTLTIVSFAGCEFLLTDNSSPNIPTDNSSVEQEDSSLEEERAFYVVVFKQDGKDDIVRQVEKGKGLTDVPTPEQKTGYTIKWSVEDFSSITGDMTVTTVITPNEYTVTYDAGEGAVAPATQKVTYGGIPATFATPTRENYSFVCWTYNGNAVLATDVWKFAEDITLVAKWQENQKYTVEFVQTGYTNLTFEVYEGGSLSMSDVAKPQQVTGYTVEWDLTDIDLTNITSPITVTAKATANEYTIVYDAGEGTVPTTSQRVTYDSIPGSFATPTREHYTFVCWTYQGNPVLPSDAWKIAQDVKLVAKWQEDEKLVVEFVQTGYTSLKFEVYEGDSLSMDGVAQPKQLTGYTVEWDLTGVDLTNITTSLVIPTKVTPKQYTITYDAGEGTVTPATQKVTYNTVPQTFATPTRENYTFVCWTYKDNAVLPTDAWKIAEDVTLVAKWQENKKYIVEFVQTGYTTLQYEVYEGKSLSMDDVAKPQQVTGYTVEWDLDGKDLSNVTSPMTIYTKATANTYKITYDAGIGTVTITQQYVTYDTAPGSFIIPTREGYKFKGWEYEGKLLSASDAWTIASDVTLTAKWAKICTITFNVKSGVLTETTMTVVVGEAYTLPTPIKEAYNFLGWKYGSTKLSMTGTWTIDETEVTLNADWVEDGWTKNY